MSPLSHHRHKRHSRHALTLCELVIVLLLISVGSAVALPKWSEFLNQRRVAAAAQRITVDIQRVQAAAYATSTAKSILFDTVKNQYSITGLTSLNSSSGDYVVQLAEDEYRCTLRTVFGETGTKTLAFNGFGETATGGNIIVAAGSVTKTVVIDAATGKAAVK